MDTFIWEKKNIHTLLKRCKSAHCWCVLLRTWTQPYLHGNATTPLQVIARVEGDCGCNSRRRAGFQAVAGTNKLWQGLKSVDPQLDELTLERKRAKRSTGRLGGNIESEKTKKQTNVAWQDTEFSHWTHYHSITAALVALTLEWAKLFNYAINWLWGKRCPFGRSAGPRRWRS